MIYAMRVLTSVGALIIQIILLKKLIEIRKLLKRRMEDAESTEGTDNENTHSDIPEWVEKFIDDYMFNSEKSIHQ